MTILYIDCAEGFSAEMLLGSLIDMGASPSYISLRLQDEGLDGEILHSRVLRNGMEGTLAYCTPTKGTVSAVFAAIESFSPEYIVCGNKSCISEEDKKLMDNIANEYGNPPDGYIMCDGYGAAPDEEDKGLLRCVLYNCGEPSSESSSLVEYAKEADLRIYV